MAQDNLETEMRDVAPDPDEIDRTPTSEREGRMASIQRASADPKKLAVMFAIFAGAIFLFFALIDGVRSDNELPEIPAKPQRTAGQYDPDTIIAPTLESAATDPNAPVTFEGEQVPAIGEAPYPQQAAGPPPKSERQQLAEASRRSGLIAYGGQSAVAGRLGAGLGGNIGQVSTASSAGGQGTRPRQPTALDTARNASVIGRRSARAIGNRNYLITAGTHIPCVLQSAMDSSVPGFTSCIIPRDVYSENGRVVLLEKGTKVLGEYQGGLNRGQYRLFVLWSRAITPRGISIDLASPASDDLGRAGLAGGVETFFWERFGTALLFSLVEDAAVIAGDQLGNQGNNVTRVPSDTASTILQDSQQIKPVLRKNQGEDVGIFVAQDFDFSSVYGLRIK